MRSKAILVRLTLPEHSSASVPQAANHRTAIGDYAHRRLTHRVWTSGGSGHPIKAHLTHYPTLRLRDIRMNAALLPVLRCHHDALEVLIQLSWSFSPAVSGRPRSCRLGPVVPTVEFSGTAVPPADFLAAYYDEVPREDREPYETGRLESRAAAHFRSGLTRPLGKPGRHYSGQGQYGSPCGRQ
jgi:hypothetical protein